MWRMNHALFQRTGRLTDWLILPVPPPITHLPGMLASHTNLPVLGVPVESKALSGMDSLLSIVQMPAGVPVGTLAIGVAGAKNAALLSAQILALGNSGIAARLATWRQTQTDNVAQTPT